MSTETIDFVNCVSNKSFNKEECRSILYSVGVNTNDPISSAVIAGRTRNNSPTVYRLIQKLHFAGAFQTVLKPGSESRISNIRNEMEMARIQYEAACISAQKSKGDIFWFYNNKTDDAWISRMYVKFLNRKKELSIQERRYWRYRRLSFRGLILYVYIESLIHNERIQKHQGRKRNNNKGPKRKKLSDKYRQNILKVLSNPVTTEEIPFLMYWPEFRKSGFDVIGTLMNISSELINQLHVDAEEDNYLIRRATERYFIDINNYYYEDFESRILPAELYLTEIEIQEEKELRNRLRDYRCAVIHIQKTWLLTQLENLDRLLEYSMNV